jgi:hypothetical protein
MLRHARDSVFIHSNTRALAITLVAMKIQEQIKLINTVLPNVNAHDKPVYKNMLVELHQRLSSGQRQSEADAEAPAKRVRQAGCPKPKRRVNYIVLHRSYTVLALPHREIHQRARKTKAGQGAKPLNEPSKR